MFQDAASLPGKQTFVVREDGEGGAQAGTQRLGEGAAPSLRISLFMVF
jgi:hypothetical protein